MTIRSMLVGVGSYLPEKIVTNDELSERLDTSDEWIRGRTGIGQRHIVSGSENAVYMASRAAQRALDFAGIDPVDVDAVIVATSTPDQVFPATAVRVLGDLGVTNGFGFDVAAACSGFIYALSMADAFIRARNAKCVVVIGSEVYSRILDWSDRGTAVLFGDGAGAVVLQASEDPGERGVLSTHLHADGSTGDLLYIDGAIGRPDHTGHLRMNGREVFRHAVAKLASSVDEALETAGLAASDVSWLVPHQANIRIIEGVARKLQMPMEKVVVTADRHANTSAASIPLALDEAMRDGRIKRGDLVLMEALGGGLTWGSALVRI
ncbi:MAG: beta-ketoacyl-ACP synthase III [Acetobacter aceti]|uniref:Beta-ketoacyl-[acyl-carrier-protein] synthase III n=1 Tax=Acetobacter aceti TaxID=435 RepID=A0A1U9KIS9_ACEAC|nr:beta-ketoacyl-ACP synthase III [Acetobacter aceti]AQS85711.1 3-oxoacyl-ACP synthase [Acetobacter aceti]